MNFREPLPDGLRAGFAVALACEESAHASDQAQDIVELWLRRSTGFREQMDGANFIGIEEQMCVQIGAGPIQICSAIAEQHRNETLNTDVRDHYTVPGEKGTVQP